MDYLRLAEEAEEKLDGAKAALESLAGDAGIYVHDRCIGDEVGQAYEEQDENESKVESALEDVSRLASAIRELHKENVKVKAHIQSLEHDNAFIAGMCEEEVARLKSKLEKKDEALRRIKALRWPREEAKIADAALPPHTRRGGAIVAPECGEMDRGGKYDSLRPKGMNIEQIVYLETEGKEPELVFYGTDAMGLRWHGSAPCKAISVLPMVLSDEARAAIKAVDEGTPEAREQKP